MSQPSTNKWNFDNETYLDGYLFLGLLLYSLDHKSKAALAKALFVLVQVTELSHILLIFVL